MPDQSLTDLPTTYLFVPADRPERFSKALASGADRVIIDLEDAVAADSKDGGRAAIADADLDWSRVAIRINDATTPFHEDDIALLKTISVPAVMVPKAGSADMLAAISGALGDTCLLLPQVETVKSLFALPELLASPGVGRVFFGHLDFALDLGSGLDQDALRHVRSQIVLQSRFAGKPAPVDSVTPDFHNLESVTADALAARNLGFGGKLLIHPAQVEPVRHVFGPSENAIDWARRVIAAMEDGNRGAVSVDGQMIDRPVEEAARLILRRAGATC